MKSLKYFGSMLKKNIWIYMISILIIFGIIIWMSTSKEAFVPSFGKGSIYKKPIQPQPPRPQPPQPQPPQNQPQLSKLTTFDDFCLDLPDGDTTSGTKLQLRECNHTHAQNFGYDWNSKIIKHNPSGKCIQTSNRGMPLTLQNCNNKDIQKWEEKKVGNMGQSWKSMANNLCIDIKNNNIKNGTPIQAFDCNDTSAQLMNFYYYKPGDKSPVEIKKEAEAKAKKQAEEKQIAVESSKKQADFLNDWIDDGCQAAGIRRYARQVDAKNMDWEKAADVVIEYQVPKIGQFFKTGNVLYIGKEKKTIGGMWVAVYVNDPNCGDVTSVLGNTLKDLEKIPGYGQIYAPIIKAWTGIVPIEDVINTIKTQNIF